MADDNIFADVLAKLGHAAHHAQAFYHGVDGWANDGAYTIEVERDAQTGEHIVWVQLAKDPPRSDWGLVIGDIVHNARSALDHLVYTLVDYYQGPPPPDPVPWSSPWKRLACPVVIDPDNWNGAELSQLWGIPPSIQTAIKNAQPFVTGPHAPGREPLSVLNDLWNIDKHRRIHLAEVFVSLSSFTASVNGRELPTRITAQYTRSEREGRAEIGRVRRIGHLTPPSEADVEMNVGLAPEIAFDQAPPTYGARVLETIRLTVLAATELIGSAITATATCKAPPSPNRP